MNRNMGIVFLIILALILLIDFFTYKAIITISNYSYWELNYKIFRIIYWLIPVIMVVSFGLLSINNPDSGSIGLFYWFMLFATAFMVFYFPRLLFLPIYGLELAFVKIKALITGINASGFVVSKVMGVIVSLLMFILLMGNIWGRFAFKTVTEPIVFVNLPAAFNGYRVVQISDFHIGSFYYHPRQVKRVIKKINALDADVIVFTGDLVNNLAEEAYKYIPDLQRIKAKHGKYAVMGNHDYGDHFDWASEDAKLKGISKTEQLYIDAGFELLTNKADAITIGNDSIYMVGVDNWGLPPFPQYGDLTKALTGIPDEAFKILLSHDPTHWDEEIVPMSNVDLTLSGHTHGMQFGIKTKGFKWSLVALKYPKWGGVYKEGKQVMHVSVGMGNIGYLGRFGIWPEINVIELKCR